MANGVIDFLESFKIKNRVRNGGKTVQKRKRVAGKAGYSYDSTEKRSKKIDAVKRMRMKKAAKLAAIKRRSKKHIANVRRKKSMKRRSALGWN